MASEKRRAAARRKAWGRGPMILRFEALEHRQLLTDGLVTIAAPAGARPDLVLTAFDTLHNLDHGESFQAVGIVENLGDAEAPAGIEVDVYASPTRTLGSNAVFVGTTTLDEPIAPGARVTFREPMAAPPVAIPGLGTASTYFFVAKVDPQDKVAEKDETNNGGNEIDPASLVTITPRPQALLSPVSMGVGTLDAAWGQTLTLSAQVANNSGAIVPASRARVVLAPRGQSPKDPAAVTIGELTVPEVGVAQAITLNAPITLPERPPGPLSPFHRFTVSVLADGGTTEALLGSTSIQIPFGTPFAAGQKPDVAVASLQPLDTELIWTEPVRVKATVENNGARPSGPLRIAFSLADANQPGAAPLAVADAILPGLAPGYSQEILQTIDLHGKLPEGFDQAKFDGRIVVRVDPENSIDESNEANNQLVSAPVTLKLLTREGLRTDVPKPGPVTTPAPVASPPSQPTPPVVAKPTPATPKPTPATPRPANPAPANPAPARPAPVDPGPVTPAPARPTPTAPVVNRPTPIHPAPVTPPPANPTPAVPSPASPDTESPIRQILRRRLQPQQPQRPQRPTAEQIAERVAMRQALLTLRAQQNRLGLRVFRDVAHNDAAIRGPWFRGRTPRS